MTQAPNIGLGMEKAITYTHHAEKRMLERGISKAEVEQVLAAPLRKMAGKSFKAG